MPPVWGFAFLIAVHVSVLASQQVAVSVAVYNGGGVSNVPIFQGIYLS
jgi:hypothetical protein